MKASELIKELESTLKNYGDWEIVDISGHPVVGTDAYIVLNDAGVIELKITNSTEGAVLSEASK